MSTVQVRFGSKKVESLNYSSFTPQTSSIAKTTPMRVMRTQIGYKIATNDDEYLFKPYESNYGYMHHHSSYNPESNPYSSRGHLGEKKISLKSTGSVMSKS
jgi:hypothetical protein